MEHEHRQPVKPPPRKVRGPEPRPQTATPQLPRAGNAALARFVREQPPPAGAGALVPAPPAAGALAEVESAVPELLRPIVDKLLAAIRAGLLPVDPAQARILLAMLRGFTAEAARSTAEEPVDAGPGTVAPPGMVALSDVLGRMLNADVREILGGDDLFFPASWLPGQPPRRPADELEAPESELAVVPSKPQAFYRLVFDNLLHSPFDAFGPAELAALLAGLNRPVGPVAEGALVPAGRGDDAAALLARILPPPVLAFLRVHRRQLPLSWLLLRAVAFDVAQAQSLMILLLPALPPPNLLSHVAVADCIAGERPASRWLAVSAMQELHYDFAKIDRELPRITTHAPTLLAAGATRKQTTTLLVNLCTAAPQAVDLQTAVRFSRDLIVSHNLAPLEAGTLALVLLPAHAARPAPGLTATHVQRASQIYAVTRSTAAVQRWLAAGAKLTHMQTPAPPRVLKDVHAGHPLDTLLPGGDTPIRTLITNLHRPYAPGPLVIDCARRLQDARVSPADREDLLTDLITIINLPLHFERATDVACELVRNGQAIADIRPFIANHLALVTGWECAPVVANLAARPQFDWAPLPPVLTWLQSLGRQAALKLLRTRLAEPTLTLTKLEHRLPGFQPHPLPAVQQPAPEQQFAAVEAALKARGQAWSDDSWRWLRLAFGHLRCTSDELIAFVTVNAVKDTLKTTVPKQNAAYWLYLFALHHVGPPAGAFTSVLVAVPHVTGSRTVEINTWIIHHVRKGHTFANFEFSVANINRAASSTLLAPPTTNTEIATSIRGAILTADTTSATWGGAHPFNAGSYKVRINNNGAGHPWTLGQFYIELPGTSGIKIPAAVLHAIRNSFASLSS
jgi:hypothetical protein